MTRNPMVRKLRAILVVVLLGATGFFVYRFGRRTRADQVVKPVSGIWVVDDSVLIKGDSPPVSSNAIWDGKTIKLFGMRNEVVSFQIAVRPPQAMLDLQYTIEPLAGAGGLALPASAVTVFREHYLEVTVPSQDGERPIPHRQGAGWYPCQAVPLAAGKSIDAHADRAAAFWFDITIPPDAKPGRYQGRVTAGGAALQASYDLELEVLPLDMPREIHFRNWFYYGPEQMSEYYGAKDVTQILTRERAFHKLAHDHRMSMGTEMTLEGAGFRWDAWWGRFGPYLTGSAFDSGPCRGVGLCVQPVNIAREASEKDFKAAAKEIVQFFSDKKLLPKVVFSCWDEPGDADAYREIRRIGQWTHDAVGKKLPVMVTEQVAPEKPEWGSLEGYLDIFCSDKSSDAEMARVRNAGGQVWVYNGGLAGAPLIDCPLLGMAAWGPAMWRWKIGAWYMWDCTYWRQKHYGVKVATDLYSNPLTFDETLRKKDGKPYPAAWAMRMNGDGVLIYPGEPVGVAGPVASLRMKAVRRGAQDYEYLWLLKQKGQEKQADEFACRLATDRYQYEENPDAWHKARREMADLLLGAKR